MSFIVPDELPEDWSVVKLGQLFRERNERVSDEDFPPLSVTMDGIVPQLDHVALTDHNDNRKLVRAGDIVINSRSDRKGAAGRAPLDGSVSLISTVLEPTLGNGHFFHHLIRSKPFQEEFYRQGKGIHSDLWTTRYDQMKRIEVAVPSEDTQRAIASFLDRETASIDTLIEKKRRLLELLEERRAAVITRAVTRGVNPDVPMKDSGVDWIGEIPEHWDVLRLKHLVPADRPITYGIVQAGPHDPEGVPYIKTSDMSGESLPIDGYQKTSREIDSQYARSRVAPGDVVVAIRATVGKTLVVPEGLRVANLTQGTARVAPSDKVESEFLRTGLSGKHTQQRLEALAKGATFSEITLGMLRDLEFVLPPVEEQKHLMNRVQEHLAITSAVARKAREAISLLREYRISLISAAVTGKVDVARANEPSR